MSEKILKSGGLEIIKVYVPPNPPYRNEFYCLYRVEGYPHQFLNATAAWYKAAELQEVTNVH